MSEIKQIIKGYIQEQSFQAVNDTDSLVQSRLLSSIMIVDLAVSLEEHFNIKIPFTEITQENFETVELLEKYLLTKGIRL